MSLSELTTTDLKASLDSPLVLLGLMYLASIASALKQLIVARQAGTRVTCMRYLRYWPETAVTVLSNLLAFMVLVTFDQLNLASSLGVGYGINSITDLIRPGGRSSGLNNGGTDK